MNSTGTAVNLDTGQETECKLVFPEEADASQEGPVLAPIGTAMLGYRVGDTFEWRGTGGREALPRGGGDSPTGSIGEYHL